MVILPKIPIGEYVELAVFWFELHLGWLLDFISDRLHDYRAQVLVTVFPADSVHDYPSCLCLFHGKEKPETCRGYFFRASDYRQSGTLGAFNRDPIPCDLLNIPGTYYRNSSGNYRC